MHVEIQVALNFLISFLYNKLPRRRVNQFGEELEQALKNKFAGHWYPNQPAKGSAYRCIKTQNPLDPVFEIAARNCGLELSDVQEYLPSELTIWCEPGEVSYRMSEKSPVKLLYQENEQNGLIKRVQSFNTSSEQQTTYNLKENNNDLMYNFTNSSTVTSNSTIASSNNSNNNINNNNNNNNLTNNLNNNTTTEQTNELSNGSPGNSNSTTSSNHSSTTSSSIDSGFNDVELAKRKIRSFNPEAQCFKPIEGSTLSSFNNNSTTNQFANSMMANNYSFSIQSNSVGGLNPTNAAPFSTNTNATSYFASNSSANLKSPNNNTTNSTNIVPTAALAPKKTQMTVGEFAATKFGSTKLKTTNNSSTGAITCGINGTTKRNYSNRMSPTEFSNYIKQRALLQQQQQQQHHHHQQQQSINNTLSQSLDGGHQLHQLQVPLSNTSNFNSFGLNNNLFNGLSPQQSRSISPISNQDSNFLLMAAAAAVSKNNSTNQVTNGLNANNLMRTTLNTQNTSPITANTNSISGLNSTGNSVCSSLSSQNSGSSSLKLMLNSQTNNTSTNLLLSSPSSAPAGESLLSDINYLSELFNNASLSPILGNSASLNNSSHNLNCGPNGLINSSLNNTMNLMKQQQPNNSMNRFNAGPNSFLDLNANSFTNYNSLIGSKQQPDQQFNLQDITSQASGRHANQLNQPQQPSTTQQQQQQQQQNQSAKSADGNNNNEKQQFNDSYSMSNGVIYPNQYQHLLVAN